MNPILEADAYTIAGDCLVSERARGKSVYNFTNRRSPIDAFDCAYDSRMVFFGLADFVRNIKRVTQKHLDEAVDFMSTAQGGNPLPFNKQIWQEIVDNHGNLPIIIRAIPEGSTFYPHEPVIEVESYPGYGEIAAHIEAVMVGQVSIATARATLTRHLLERIIDVHHDYLGGNREDHIEASRWFVHDFGMRASSCEHESNILGQAHLLSFYGTDTFNAALSVRRMGAKPPTGSSILALAHRTVQGYESENDCFVNLSKHGDIGSYVADCYDFKKALKKLVEIAKTGKTVVVRPDSGDFLENIRLIVKTALDNQLYTLDAAGNPTSTTLKFICGDSMNWQKTRLMFDTLQNMGVSPIGWGIVGIGGWLRNIPNRDILSSAYKLCFTDEPVIKLSETDAKLSVPGPCTITRKEFPSVHLLNEGREDIKRIYYERGYKTELVNENFQVIQNRVINEFNLGPTKNYGLNQGCLSTKIKELQLELRRKYS